MLTDALTKRSVSVRTFWSRDTVSPLLRLSTSWNLTRKRAAQAVVEHLPADLLGDELQDVVLQRPRQARGESHRRRDEQPAEGPAHQLGLGPARGVEHVPVDDAAEDQRVDEGQQLREPRQQQGEGHEPRVRAQVPPECVSRRGHPRRTAVGMVASRRRERSTRVAQAADPSSTIVVAAVDWATTGALRPANPAASRTPSPPHAYQTESPPAAA